MVVGLYVFAIVTAELMGAKTFHIATIGGFHLNGGVAIFLMPVLFTLTDVMVEVYGKARAHSMVFTGLLAVSLLVLYTVLATSLPPSGRFAPMEPAYDTVFHASVRISLASLAAFLASALLDIAIFSRLRRIMHTRALWLRNNVSNFISELVDSTVLLTLAFYSFQRTPLDNLDFLVGIILPYWLLKCAMSVLTTPLVYAGVGWLRRSRTPAAPPA